MELFWSSDEKCSGPFGIPEPVAAVLGNKAFLDPGKNRTGLNESMESCKD